MPQIQQPHRIAEIRPAYQEYDLLLPFIICAAVALRNLIFGDVV